MNFCYPSIQKAAEHLLALYPGRYRAVSRLRQRGVTGRLSGNRRGARYLGSCSPGNLGKQGTKWTMLVQSRSKIDLSTYSTTHFGEHAGGGGGYRHTKNPGYGPDLLSVHVFNAVSVRLNVFLLRSVKATQSG